MSTINKLNYLNTTKNDLKTVINYSGANLTTDTFRNYPKKLYSKYLDMITYGTDDLYASMPKVVGEGTETSLDNTLKTPMQIKYKGNTYQYSTSGKNLLVYPYGDTPNSPINTNGVKWTDNGDGSITAYGSATGYSAFTISSLNKRLYIEPNTTYTLSGCDTAKNVVFDCAEYDTNGTLINNHTSVSNVTFTTGANSSYLIISIKRRTNGAIDTTIYPQLEKGSTITSWEPYTNGASPNPDYPQPIQVVSGDNSIEVCGKNLINIEEYLSYAASYTKNSDGSYTFATTTSLYNEGMPVNFSQEFTISYSLLNVTGTNFGIRCGFADGYQLDVPRSGSSTTEYYNVAYKVTQSTLNNHGNVTSLRGNWSVAGTFTIKDLMIEYGAKTSYVPYTGASYPINLPVENLFNPALLSQETNYNTYDSATGLWTTNSGGSYARSILYNVTGNNTRDTTKLIKLAPNTTYTLTLYDFTKYTSDTNYLSLSFFDSNGAIIGSSIDTKGSPTFTTPNQECWLDIGRSNNSGYFTFSNIQLEKGTKANSFTPYGTTPIELCKIGTYQDKIDKSTGKNLFDIKEFMTSRGATYIENSDGSISTDTNKSSVYSQPYVFSNTDIPVSLSGIIDNGTSTNIRVQLLNSNNEAVGEIYSSVSSITNKNACKLRFNWSTAGTFTLKNIMLNLGTTALPYEPYGTSWYLKKEIGKVVLKDVYYSLSTTLTNVVRARATISFEASSTPNGVCNGFVFLGNYSSDSEHFYIQSTSIWVFINKTRLSEISDTGINNFIDSNDFYAYYVLATPTYTLIEGELLNQLEAIKMSYEGQTNLSQTNNNMPFVINASALEKY